MSGCLERKKKGEKKGVEVFPIQIHSSVPEKSKYRDAEVFFLGEGEVSLFLFFFYFLFFLRIQCSGPKTPVEISTSNTRPI